MRVLILGSFVFLFSCCKRFGGIESIFFFFFWIMALRIHHGCVTTTWLERFLEFFIPWWFVCVSGEERRLVNRGII